MTKREMPAGLRVALCTENAQGKITSVILSRSCSECNVVETATVEESQLLRYLDGAAVQDAFPDMDADRRELFFMIPRFCGKCWDKMFGLSPVNTANAATVEYHSRCTYCGYAYDNMSVFGCPRHNKHDVCNMCCDCCWPYGKQLANNSFTRTRARKFAKQMAIKHIPIEGELRLTKRGKIVVAVLIATAMIAILWVTKDYMWFNGHYMKFEDVQKYIQEHPEPVPVELVYP